MKVQEHSRIANKFLDPERYLNAMFPRFEECGTCHSVMTLESAQDVHHATYTHEHMAYRKDWLQWKCPVCKNPNEFTHDEVLVDAHRRMFKSKHDIGEWIAIGAVIVFALLLLSSATIFV